MPVKNRIQLRRGTSTQWGNSADILASGEMGLDSTENKIKIGNGTNYWVDLPWLAVAGGGVSGHVAFWTDNNTLSYDNNQLVWDSTNNRLGIGISAPTTELDVVGSGNFTGDLSVDGHLSSSTKSFLINHPTKEGKKLQYGSLESPYHGVRLTGRDSLKDGICIVKLPSYMKKLVKEEDINIQITNYKHAKTLYVEDIDLEKNCFVVKGHRCKTLGQLEFFWTFTAVRKDVPDLIVEK